MRVFSILLTGCLLLGPGAARPRPFQTARARILASGIGRARRSAMVRSVRRNFD